MTFKEAERARTVQHGEETAQEELINVCEYMIGVEVG